MYCKNCGAKLKEGQKFCSKCGTPVPEIRDEIIETDEIKASHEHQKTNENNAGQQVVHRYANENASTAESATPKQNNTRIIIAIIATIAILAVAIIVVGVSRTNESAKQKEEKIEEETIIDESEGQEIETSDSDLSDYITVSDISIDDIIHYREYSASMHEEQETVATGSIKNDYDKACEVTIDYEYERQSTDNYGDAYTETYYTPESYYVPANSVYSIFTIIRFDADDPNVYYTGNYEVEDVSGLSENFDGVESVDQITNISGYLNDFGAVEYTITLLNSTGYRWQECRVSGVVLYEDGYYYYFEEEADYVKPGETAEITINLAHYISGSDEELLEKTTILPTDVVYWIDTNY